MSLLIFTTQSVHSFPFLLRVEVEVLGAFNMFLLLYAIILSAASPALGTGKIQVTIDSYVF